MYILLYYISLRFGLLVLVHMLKHVPSLMFRHVPVRHELELMPWHMIEHGLDRHVFGHVLLG